ncbi:Activity-regulated cytoskeleton associated protein 1, partial [Frankliniella fusca]
NDAPIDLIGAPHTEPERVIHILSVLNFDNDAVIVLGVDSLPLSLQHCLEDGTEWPNVFSTSENFGGVAGVTAREASDSDDRYQRRPSGSVGRPHPGFAAQCCIMDVTRLQKDELLFELGWRGANVYQQGKKVDELRPLLKGLIDKEKEGEVFEPDLPRADCDEDVIQLQTKVEALRELVRPDSGEFNPKSAARVRALASHCNRRLMMVAQREDLDDANRVEMKKSGLLLRALVSEFREFGEKPVYAASSVFEVSQVEGYEVPKPEGEVRVQSPSRKSSKSRKSRKSKKSQKSHKSRRRAVSTSSSSSSSSSSASSEPEKPKGRLSKKVPTDLNKWGIQPFSGDPSVSVCSFIADIEEKARWRGVDPNYLVIAASEFFVGDAKNWFRSINVDSWREFTRALRSEFLPVNYFDNLMEEIRARKQGPDEPIGLYVTNMRALFDRLGSGLDEEYKTDEEWKLALTVKNLAPFYTERLALVKIASFEHLKILGRDLESTRSRIEAYDGKSRLRKMEPEFAAKPARPRPKPLVNEVEAEVEAISLEPKPEVAVAMPPRPQRPRTFNKEVEEVEVIEVDVLPDGRLYVLIEIYGVDFFGLLDSGATVSTVGGKAWNKLNSSNRTSIIGRDSWNKLQNSQLQLAPSITKHVKVANGQTCPVLGRLDAPVVLDGKMKVCSFLVVPELQQGIILGLDFWRVFGLLPNVVKGTCVLAEADLPVMSEVIIPMDKLTEEERALLDSVVSRYRETLGRPGLGCTTLVEHRIDTGDAKPIRQRYYSYSPKLLDVLHRGLEEWLALGVVEPSNSPWASAVLLHQGGTCSTSPRGRHILEVCRAWHSSY